MPYFLLRVIEMGTGGRGRYNPGAEEVITEGKGKDIFWTRVTPAAELNKATPHKLLQFLKNRYAVQPFHADPVLQSKQSLMHNF